MLTKTLTNPEGMKLTYYRAGDGPEHVVIANAPGMSIKFWAPIIQILKEHFTVIAFEYRGFPDCDRELSEEELRFDGLIDDLSLILEHERVEAAHFTSWCLGAKIIFEYYYRFPHKVLSLTPVSFAYTTMGLNPNGSFTAAILDIKRRIETHPESINTMITMMKRIGLVPNADFFTTIFREDEEASTLNLVDVLEMESSVSNLAFYLIDTPNGLKNYLKVYVEFRKADIIAGFKDIELPVVVIAGEKDNITPLNDQLRNDIGSIPSLEYRIVERASHFVILEFPRKVASLIQAHAGEVHSGVI